MKIIMKLLDVVSYPDQPFGPGNYIIFDNDGKLDWMNLLGLTILIIFVVVLSVLIIRRIRRGLV